MTDLAQFLRLVAPALVALAVLWSTWHLIRRFARALWRSWADGRQRPLATFPTHVLLAAWRHTPELRVAMLRRGTASKREIEAAIARNVRLVERELQRREA